MHWVKTGVSITVVITMRAVEMKLGQCIAEYLERRGMTQEDFAQKVRVETKLINQLIRGEKVTADYPTLIRMASVLGKDELNFIYGEQKQ